MAVDTRAHSTPRASRGLRVPRRARRREADRVPRLGVVDAEAAAGARPHARVLRARVRERPPRRLPARRARDGGLRGRAAQGRGLRQRAVRARGDLHPQRDGGDQPRRLRVGAREPRPRRHRRDHRARASRELRPVAVHRQPDGRELPSHPDRRSRRAPARRARRRSPGKGRSRSSPPASSRTRSARSTRSSSSRPGRTSRGRSWSSTPPRRRRTGRSTCRRSAATSSRSPRTSSAGRAGSGRCGAGRELLEAMAPFNLGGEMIRSVEPRADDLQRASAQVRGRHAGDRRGGRLRRCDRLHQRDRAPRDRAARARADRLRDGPARRARLGPAVRPSGRAAGGDRLVRGCGHPSARRGADPRLGRHLRSAPVTTAPSR